MDGKANPGLDSGDHTMAKIPFTIWLISDDPNWPDQPEYQVRLDSTLIEKWMPGTLVPGAPPQSVFVVRERESGKQAKLRASATGPTGTTLQIQVVRGDGSVPVNQNLNVPFLPVTIAFTV